MVVCEHLIADIKRVDLVCERGTVTFETCGTCGHLVNIFRTKDLYLANYYGEHEPRQYCQHEKIVDEQPVGFWKSEICDCDRGSFKIIYCGCCGQYEQSIESKELYIANYQVYDEIKEAQRLREEHAKTTGTNY